MSATAPEPLLLTINDAAHLLSIGRTLMYALIRTGEIKTVTIGRVKRVHRQTLLEYVAARLAMADQGRTSEAGDPPDTSRPRAIHLTTTDEGAMR